MDLQKELNEYRRRYIRTAVFIPNFEEAPVYNIRQHYNNYGSSDLNEWLRNTYHPQIVRTGFSRTGTIKGYLRMFMTADDVMPTMFSDPKTGIEDVYNLCQLFTYQWMSVTRASTNALSMMASYNQRSTTDIQGKWRDCIDHCNLVIDQALLKKFKSTANLADACYRFICENE